MAKKITKTENTEGTTEVVDFNGTALSIIPHGNKKYSVVKVSFSEESLVPGLVSIVEGNVDLYQAKDTFKREVVKAKLFDVREK